ncbi:MAG: dihydrofolate reductase [Bacteroidales bacterium]|nr:dihydrofolate reductase [Bacteroidales bacterium]
MKLILIAAVANNNVIGGDNKLLWNLPADLKRFKELTMGHTLIMGRKTFESIGKALPGRRTVIVTRQNDYKAEGCEIASDLKDAICKVREESDVFVAGGGEIYRQVIGLHYARRIFMTRVYANFEGDSFFPNIDPEKWELVERDEFQPDEKNPYPFAFLTYKRRK